MAERRMFAKSVVMDDKFLRLPAIVRCLYFTLGMEADDDGFVHHPHTVRRMCAARKQDLQMLCDLGYVQFFESGVAVLIHWNVNNQIRKDRYKPSVHVEEKGRIFITSNNTYHVCQALSEHPGCQKTENPDTQYRLG